MTSRVSSAGFVGRSAELAELKVALRDAGSSRPSLAFVAGESGVGKSRLADELIHRARSTGARVLAGECVDLGSSELPYAPLIAALRPLARDGDPVLDALPAHVRADLASLLPGLGVAPDGGEPPQLRLFEALLALLEAFGEQQPVLLLIEDLHWADSSTRGFVTFLARMACRERLLVVGTYRTDELHRRHPLRPLLAELTRDPGTRLVELEPFTRDELAAQLEDILGHPPEHSLVERLHSRSGGNALFAEELLAAGLDGRGSLPPTLRDALMVRVEKLPAETQELLRWLACQPLDHELLAQLSQLEARQLSTALREAMASHIVVVDEGVYGFRHALLREVVRDDLLPGERTQLHRAIAEALEDRLGEGEPGAHLSAQIAYHWTEAQDQPAALAASMRAAAAAEHVQAYAEAASLYARALELWERVAEAARLAGCDHVALLARAANAADLAGDATRQEMLLERALGMVDEHAEPRRAAFLLERLHRAQWSLNRQERGVETIDRALALLEPDEQTSERAALLAAKARARMLQGRHREAADAGRAALAVAQAIGDSRVEARALSALGIALFGQGDVAGGTRTLRDGVAIAREHELLDELATLYANLADMLHISARSDEALEVVHEAHDVLGDHDSRARAWLRLLLSEIRFDAGDWDAAEAAIPRLERGNVGTLLLNQRLRRAELLLGRGELGAAREQIEGAARVARGSTEPQFVGVLGVACAELELREGDFDAARTALDDALDQIEFCSDDVTRIARLARAGVTVEAEAAQHARDRRDAEGERAALGRAAQFLERSRAAAQAELPVECAQLALAEAEHARARGEDDPELWSAAGAAWRAIGRPYPVAYATWRRAEALLARGDREGASAAARGALDDASALGSRWLVAEVESLAARARLDVGVAAAAVEDASAEEREDPFGLTARERQVLELVARGATNREIGLELHMAEKTASVHVSRILAKLDVRSRTEAAGVAHRLGLTDAGAPA